MDMFNIIGFIGTGLYILSYLLLQMKKIDSGLIYTIMNLFAAGLVIISLTKYWNAPSFIIQAVWVLISLVGIAKILIKDKSILKTKKQLDSKEG